MFYLVFKLGTIQRMVKGTHALWSACFYMRCWIPCCVLVNSIFYIPMRVKDGMCLRNGMWHGLRKDIIMWNVIYAK